MKETLWQKIVSWAYVKWVLLPKVREGYCVQISLLSNEEADAYLDKGEWKQNKENAELAMYEKMFEKEQ